jgi:3alpha(or 20beta)-hydroxysteroid dehydrogenase
MTAGRLAEKVVIVSAAAHGMGLSHTRALLREGARVVALDFDPAAGQALVAEHGLDRLAFVQGDVTSAADWERVVRDAKARFGVINVLLNSATISPPNRLENVTEAAYRRVVDVNQVGSFLGMQAVIPAMRDYGGSIINIASTAAVTGVPGAFANVASEWAVRGMTKAAAVELAEARIRVNVLCPAHVASPNGQASAMRAGGMPEPVDRPLRRWPRPEQISAAVVFLASDDSAFVSGVELVVDGAYPTI